MIKSLKIGVTGGIGSGKTTICKIFASMGIPIYNSDLRAKSIMVENMDVVEQIIDNIGADSYFKDGSLNRAYIAGIVFRQKEKLEILNKIVHPAVRLDGLKWDEEQVGTPYTIKEAALMIESGNYKGLDKIIVVTAPKDIRIARVVQRDKTNRDAVLARIDKQMPEAEKVKYADYIIVNDGHHSLVKQAYKIHRSLVDLHAPQKRIS